MKQLFKFRRKEGDPENFQFRKRPLIESWRGRNSISRYMIPYLISGHGNGRRRKIWKGRTSLTIWVSPYYAISFLPQKKMIGNASQKTKKVH